MSQDVNDRRAGPWTLTAGQVGPHSFDFIIRAATELRVSRHRAGVETVLAHAVDYTVAGSFPGTGSITLTAPPLADDQLVIDGLRPQASPGVDEVTERLQAASLNIKFDTLLRDGQEVRRDLAGAIRVPRGEVGEMVIPGLSVRQAAGAGSVFTFDGATGLPGVRSYAGIVSDAGALVGADALAQVIAQGDFQDARVIAEGDAQDARVVAEGDAQVARAVSQGDIEIARVQSTGAAEVSGVQAAGAAEVANVASARNAVYASDAQDGVDGTAIGEHFVIVETTAAGNPVFNVYENIDDTAANVALVAGIVSQQENELLPTLLARLRANNLELEVEGDRFVFKDANGRRLFGVWSSGKVEILGLSFGLDAADDLFRVKSGDDRILMRVLSSFAFDILGLRIGLTGGAFRLEDQRARALLSYVEGRGSFALSLDHNRFEYGLPYLPVPDVPGQLTAVRCNGVYTQFRRDGVDMIARLTGDEHAPVLLDGPHREILETIGRSWMVRPDFDQVRIDADDATGRTRANFLARIPNANVTRQRIGAAGTEDPSQPYVKRPLSDNVEITGLHRVKPEGLFTLGLLVAHLVDLRRADLGLPRPQIIHQSSGRGGQTPNKFLPAGSSFTDGVTTVNAALTDGFGHYLWDADRALFSQITAELRNNWFDGRLSASHLPVAFSPEATPALYSAFLTEFRVQQDLLGLGPRNHFYVPHVEQYNSPVWTEGGQGLVDFCRANASGKEWLVGAGYAYPLHDEVHRSSWSRIALAELIALAIAYVERFGNWEPLWLDPSSIAISGNELLIRTNRPRQAVGDLVADTSLLPYRADLGFNLREGPAELVSSVALAGDTITITATEPLAGKTLKLYYGALPPPGFDTGAAVLPTYSDTGFSSCWGLVHMAGYDAPLILGNAPNLPHFLTETVIDIAA